MKKYAIIVAGGKGLRMGTGLPKQFLSLRGLPVLMHTLTAFHVYDPDLSILLVLPRKHQDYWKNLCDKYNFTIQHQVVDGGETRFHSVKNGVEAIWGAGSREQDAGEDEVLIAIHDGVRPLVSKEIIGRCFDNAAKNGGAYPVIPVTDTLRMKTDSGSITVDRTSYFLVQTPQVFQSGILLEAFRQPYSESFTDDVSVVESLGKYTIIPVEGEKNNLKITTPFDLLIAESLLDF